MKQIKIDIPDGYEIDKENSTFECIRFKPKPQVYWSDEHKAVVVEDGDISFMIDTTPSYAMSWNDANRFYNNFIHWRLPMLEELKLIVKHLPAINYILKQVGGFEIFGRLWSSSTGCDSTCALTIDVNCNTKDARSVNTIAYARAVSEL
jgi:hypothetical protein